MSAPRSSDPGKDGSIEARPRAVKRAGGLRALGVAALLLVSLFHFARGVHGAREFGFVDFPIFLAQARLFLLTGELYVDRSDPESYSPAAAVYKFPPLYAVALLPVVARGVPEGAYAGHWWLQLALYAAAVALVLAALRREGGPWSIVWGAILALNFEPFFETLWRLQIETPLLLLLALALLALLRGREAWAGAALGAAAMLKVYPAFLLIHAVARRGWRTVGGALGAAALLFALGLAVIGVAQNRVFFVEILPRLLDETPRLSSENLSVGRHLQVLFGMGPQAAKRLAQLLALPLIVGSVWVAARRRGRTAGVLSEASRFALFVPPMLMAMPNSWVNYQLLLLLPMLVLLAHGCRRGPERAASIALLAAAYLPTLFYWPCEAPSVPWPCARTPWLLGLVQLPRALHDLLVETRALSPLLVWAGLLSALLYPPADSASAAAPAPEAEAPQGAG